MNSSYSHNNSSIFYNNPIFCSIVSLYIIIFLYFPQFFLKLIPSPILISTLILLLFILRIGTSQQINTRVEPELGLEPEPNLKEMSPIRLELETRSLTKLELEPNIKLHPCQLEAKFEPDPKSKLEFYNEPSPKPDFEVDPKQPEPINNPKSYYEENFESWVVWAPLEVIYEAYEGEECVDETENDAFLRDNNENPSLSRYYPESDMDTDSSSGSLDEDFVEIQEEGMFEISIGDYGFDDKRGDLVNKLKKEIEFDEEDNLIEIDISPNNSDCGFNW